MGDNTGIEWTASYKDGIVTPGATWNPIVAYHVETGKRGWFCVHQSDGCRNCYAEKINIRLGNGLAYTRQNLNAVRFQLSPKFDLPRRWARSRKIFVDSMFDPFLDAIPFGLLDPMFAVMAQSPQHTFLLLTKNPKRMREYLSDPERPEWVGQAGQAMGWCHANTAGRWPLPNVWLGVSTERQKEADERIPELLATPAAERFISYEPALGPLSIEQYLKALSWVIAGGESGQQARLSHPEWFRSLRDQCQAAAVPYFFKQWGSYAYREASPVDRGISIGNGLVAIKMSKHETGAVLDGREWREFPA